MHECKSSSWLHCICSHCLVCQVMAKKTRLPYAYQSTTLPTIASNLEQTACQDQDTHEAVPVARNGHPNDKAYNLALAGRKVQLGLLSAIDSAATWLHAR